VSDSVPAETIGEHLGVAVRFDGDRTEFASANPQHDLHRLLLWAEAHRVGLERLAVQRSSLEDLFLSIGLDGEDASVGWTTGARQ